MAILQLSNGNPDGTKLGQSAADLVALHGATATIQSTNVTAVLTTGAATALVGFATTAQLQASVDAINSILECLKAKGLMART
jgi:hypothetical protein